jgi:hypothetical protein
MKYGHSGQFRNGRDCMQRGSSETEEQRETEDDNERPQGIYGQENRDGPFHILNGLFTVHDQE